MSLPLDGCAIALGGTFPGQTQASLSSYLKGIGAQITSSVTKKTTHLITTDNDFPTNAKVRAAENKGDCHIVSLEWAHESERSGAKADETNYIVDGSGSQPTATSLSLPVGHGKPDGANGVDGANHANGTTDAKADDATQTDDKPGRRSGRKRNVPATQDAADQPAAPAPAAKKQKGTAKRATEDDEMNDTSDVKQEEDVKPAPKEEQSKPVVAEGQVAKTKDAVIPLDEGVPLPTFQVYIDDDGLIYDASLNQTNSGKNANKFYRIQLLQDGTTFRTWTRWGRVGEFGQSALLGNGGLDDAFKQYQKKFKDKTGIRWEDRANNPKPGKYAFVERSYDPDSESDEENDANGQAGDSGDKKQAAEGSEEESGPICTLKPEVASLMELIFNKDYFAATMKHLNYDANKLPLGKLSKSTIIRGFQALKDLSEIFNDPSVAQSKHGNSNSNEVVEDLSNSFYSLIPHDFGRNRPPVIRDSNFLKKEIELLESLSDMKDAADIMQIDRKKTTATVNPLDSQYRGLGLEEMTPLDHQGDEFKLLCEYLQGSKGDTHRVNYKIDEVFRIERNGEKNRFEKSKFASISSDKRLLWHGSRCTNYGGILSQGLRIAPPEAPVTGYMFGKGIYLADMSTKSANYCNASSSNGHALLLLCEAELGDPMLHLTTAKYEAGEVAKQEGKYSTLGQGNVGPLNWKDAGCVHPSLKGVKMPDVQVKPGDTNIKGTYLQYNEYITYDVSQVQLRYLFRVRM